MPFRRSFRQLTAWFAAVVWVLCSLLPVLSHAVVAAPADGQGWVEVCTASGMAWVQQTEAADNLADAATADPASPLNMGVCNWCATHGHTTGLPPVAQPLVAPLVFASSVPTAFLQSPRPLFVWAAAQSRAPPASV